MTKSDRELARKAIHELNGALTTAVLMLHAAGKDTRPVTGRADRANDFARKAFETTDPIFPAAMQSLAEVP